MKHKKLFCLTMSALLALGTFTAVGCGKKDGEKNVDSTKTQIYIGNINYGYGDDWLKKTISDFEERYANKSFEDGKTGVQVFYENGSAYGNNSLIQTAASQGCDIFFGENTAYSNFVNSGVMLDITDIVTEKLTEFGETRSIADKLTEGFGSHLKTSDNKYYALPNYECTYWINYNVQFFEDNLLYFAPDGTFIKSLEDKKSAGPDRIEGNYDDGMPATFDQFFELCDEIDNCGGIPVAWPGGIDSYRNVYLTQLHAAIEGKEQFDIGYSFDGEAKTLVKFDSQGKAVFNNGVPELETKTITPSNGYEIYRQEGRYWAINFFERILEGGYCSQGSTGSADHLTTQADFIESRYSGQPIAMLLDGNYWTNEAKDAFAQSVVNHGESASKENARFGIMPWPRQNNGREGKNSILVAGNDLAFIYSGTPANRLPAVKKFFQFAYSDEQLRNYSRIVGTMRGCDVEFTDTDKENMSEFARRTLEYRQDSDVILPCSKNRIYVNNMSDFIYFKNGLNAYIADNTYNDPIMYVREYAGNKSDNIAKLYFEGMNSFYTYSRWNSSYGTFFD